MASHEFAHCDNCLFFDRNKSDSSKGLCVRDKDDHQEVSKKLWCGSHQDKDPLDANSISIEYGLRRDHIMLEMQYGADKVKPIGDLLRSFGWDGVERVKVGKWPEEKIL